MIARCLSPWSLVVALALACCCAGSAGAQQFQEIAPGVIPDSVGIAWGDYDGDGYADLFVAGYNHPGFTAHGPMILRNNHDLSFANVSAALGLSSEAIDQDGVAWADYDNDGKLDLLAASGAGMPFLYRRDGAQFLLVTPPAGLTGAGATQGVAWCDYDGDNLLDAFLPTIGESYLYHNNGDGTLTDVHVAAGVVTSAAGGVIAESAAWGDYDNDGHPDLLVARSHGSAMLFRNNGDGTFTDVSAQAGVTVATDTWSVAWGDYDNDGWLDCYLGSIQGSRDSLLHNNVDGTFTEVGATAGMAGDVATGASLAWADYDNDGYLDLYVATWNATGTAPSFLYHNNGNGTFTNMAVGSGLEDHYSHNGAAWADLDLDGRLDLVQANGDREGRLFHNIGPAGNWLRVRVLTSATGDATGSAPARDAIGARVDVNLDNDDTFPPGTTLTRLIDGGSGHMAQNEQVAHFGLGAATLVAVRVTYPDGSVVVHWSVPPNEVADVRDVPAGRVQIFRDVPVDFWAYSEILAAFNSHVVAGYEDGTYQPAQPVTRAQMAVFIARSMLIPTGDAAVPEGPPTATFEDVPNTGYGEDRTDPYWAYKYIEYCVAQDVVRGYEGGIYDPEGIVTRDQMAVFVARAKGWVHLGDDMTSAPEVFPDVPAGHWCGTAIKACVDNSVVQGYDDGKYHPEYQVTRDQMAVYVQRAFDLPM